MEFAVLATGSRGNALVVRHDGDALLVDAGLAAKEIARRLAHFGVRPDEVRALLVSHGHDDHVRGVAALARRHRLEVVATAQTLARLSTRSLKGVVVREISPASRFDVAGFSVKAYPLPHDAPGAVQYVIQSDGRTLALATDLGAVTPAVREAIAGTGALLLEANHDALMLRRGPYPVDLKRRVAGDEGHLSNEAAAMFLVELGSRAPRLVVLGHLSEVNNRPELAGRTVDSILTASGLRPDTLEVIPQGVMRGWFEVPATQ